MFKKYFYILCFAACLFAFYLPAAAQSCVTCAEVTTFAVDLSANPDTSWSISSKRLGQCCQATGPDNCIVFQVTVNTKATTLNFLYKNGTSTHGSYEINCDPATERSPGTSQCLNGLTSFCITYCNRGHADDDYTIVTSSGYSAGPDLTLRSGCAGQMAVTGLLESSLTWTSVYPGATGAYNSYLSCTSSCDTSNVTPVAGAPAYVDYMVCGLGSGCATGNYCDTQRVYMVPALSVSISPSNPVICAGDPSPTLSSIVFGGAPPYSYSWNTGATTSTLSAPAGIYSLTVSDASSGCAPVIARDTVLSITAATANAGPDESICSGSNFVLAGSRGGSATGSSWSTSGTGSFDNATLLLATYTPSASDALAGSVTFVLTTAGPCAAASDTMVLTIIPSSSLNAGSDISICSGNNCNLSGTVSNGGITTWITSGSGAFNNPALLNAVYTPSASDIAAGNVTLVLSTSGPCGSLSDSLVVTIYRAATINAGSDTTICSGSNCTLSGSIGGGASTAVWTTNGTGTFNNPSSLSATYFPSAGDIAAGSVTLVLASNDPAGPCNPVSDTLIITILPSPSANAGANRAVCVAAPSVVLAGSVINATGGVWSGGAGTFNPNNATLNATYTPSAGEISAGTVTLILTTTGTGSCLPSSDSMNITIVSSIAVDAGPDQAVCNGATSIDLSGTTTTGSGQWSSSGTGSFSPNANTLNATYIPSAADKVAGVITLILVSTNNGGCTAMSDSASITFIAGAVANAGSNQSVCANNANVQLNGSVISISGKGKWTGNGDGIFIPADTVLNAIYQPGNADITTGSVTLILTPSDSCIATTGSITILITPEPVVNAGADIFICGGSMSANLPGSVTGGASKGKWTTMGSGTFLPNDSALNATYMLSAGDSTAGNITLVLTSTGNGNCSAASDTLSIKVTSVPVTTVGNDTTVCANTPGIPLTGIVTGGSGTGQWFTSGNGTFSPSNSALNATYLAGSADTNSGFVTLVLSSTLSCLTTTDTMVISFNASPFAYAGTNQTVCPGVPVNLNGYILDAPVFHWTTLGTGSFTPNDSDDYARYIFSAADLTAGRATLILSAANTCAAVSDSILISIRPLLVANAGNDQVVCSGTSVQLNGTISNGATTLWFTSGNGTFLPNNTALNAVYVPGSADSLAGSTMLILHTYNNCYISRDTMFLTFVSAPSVAAGNDGVICGGDSVNLNGSITAATTFQWSATGTGTFVPADTILSATYMASQADKDSGNVTLILTASNSCASAVDSVHMSFLPLPLSYAGTNQVVCPGVPVNLNGFVMDANVFHWTTLGTGNFTPNDSDDYARYVFSPSDLLNGGATLVLTATNACGAVTDSMNISIRPVLTNSAGNDQVICTGTSVQLNGTISNGASTEWYASGNGTFIPGNLSLNPVYVPGSADSLAGSTMFVFHTYNNCYISNDTTVVTYIQVPVADAGNNFVACPGTPVSLAGSAASATTVQWTTSGTGTFVPADTVLLAMYVPGQSDTLSGSVTLTLTASNICFAAVDSVLVSFSPTPVPDAGADQAVCAGVPVNLNGAFSNATGFSWTTSGTGNFTPDNVTLNATYIPSAGDISGGGVTISFNAANSCVTVTDAMSILINPVPTANAGNNQSVCEGTSVQLGGNVSAGTNSSWSTTGNGIFLPGNTDLNAVYQPGSADSLAGTVSLILIAADTGSCGNVADTLNVIIQSRPTADFTTTTSCVNAMTTFNDASSGNGGAVVSWQWNFGTDSSAAQNPSIAFPSAGMQTITLIAATAAGCRDTMMKNIFVNANPVALFTYATACPDTAHLADGSTITTGSIANWSWNFGDNSTGNNPGPLHIYSLPGSYAVTLTVTSDSGCSATVTNNISLDPCQDNSFNGPAIPTAFTPNNDGHNDLLYVRGGPFQSFDFRIYDEWGLEVFHSSAQSGGWDGTYKGSLQPTGKYIWTLNVTSAGNDVSKLIGQVMLIR